MKKQIPILFSTAMVQAILAGRKTVTRRIVKGIQENATIDIVQKMVSGHHNEHGHVTCPYGKPGDILYVRETWRKYFFVDELGYTHFDKEIFEYAADNPAPIREVDGDGWSVFNKNGTEKYIPWRPNIHLPKDRSRIWLEVTDIRVERLQQISHNDAIAEGIETVPPMGNVKNMIHYKHYLNRADTCAWPTASFRTLWQSINGKESWEANPWVWVVSFRLLSTTGKPAELEKEGRNG